VDQSDAIAEHRASARHETAIVRPNKNAEPSRVTVEEKADSSEMLISQNFRMVRGTSKSRQPFVCTDWLVLTTYRQVEANR
jgi:hypothetical protein